MGVRGKVVHSDHHGCVFIGSVERAGEVNCQGLVGFGGVRESEGLACRECGGLIVYLALIARSAVDYKVLLNWRPPEETGCRVIAFVS